MRTRGTSTSGTLLALSALVGLSGCPPCATHAVLFSEDFEGCGGTCGWEVGGGQGELVSTVHPAEHGLQLTGQQVTARREVSIALSDIRDSLLDVSLTSTCRAAYLTLELQWEGGETEALPLSDDGAGRSSLYGVLAGEKRIGRPPGSVIRAVVIKTASGCVLDRVLLFHDQGGGC